MPLIDTALLRSCGLDELTSSKAGEIVRDCEIKTNENSIKTRTIYYGLVEVQEALKSKFPEKMKQYAEFMEMGLVKIDTMPSEKGRLGRKKEVYQVSLKPKASELLVSSDTLYGKITGKFKICEYIFDSVTEVHEIPEKNIASVKVKFVRTNDTPFFKESDEKRNPKEVVKTVPFRKTTDGWKLCD